MLIEDSGKGRGDPEGTAAALNKCERERTDKGAIHAEWPMSVASAWMLGGAVRAVCRTNARAL